MESIKPKLIMDYQYTVLTKEIADLLQKLAKEKGIRPSASYRAYSQDYNVFYLSKTDDDFGFAQKISKVGYEYQEISVSDMISQIASYTPKNEKRMFINDLTIRLNNRENVIRIGNHALTVKDLEDIVATWKEINSQ